MSLKFSFIGAVKDGALVLNKDKIREILPHFEGKDVELEIKEWHRHKSRQLEKYYWAVVLTFASEHTGYMKDELHEINKLRHLPKRILDPSTKEYVTVAGSTRGMSIKEQTDFVEAVKRDYAELDIYIPDPNE
jgi:hypothetical protein